MSKTDNFAVYPAFPTEQKDGINVLGFFAAHVAAGIAATSDAVAAGPEYITEVAFVTAENMVAEYAARTEAARAEVSKE